MAPYLLDSPSPFHASKGEIELAHEYAFHQAEIEERCEESKSKTGPPVVNGPTWTGSDFPNADSFTYCLTKSEKDEIRHALRRFLESGHDGDEVNSDNFLLPTLGPRLRSMALEVHEGRGLCIIRGFTPSEYSHQDNIVIFLGLSSYIANNRGKQTDEGNIFGHLHSPQGMQQPQDSRPIKYSDVYADFHNDIGCDVLAMHTRSLAQSGGDSLFASVSTIFESISGTRPDLAEELMRPNWPFDIWSFTESRAMFFKHEGHMLATVLPHALTGLNDIPRPNSVPSLTSKQQEALDLVQHMARIHQLRVSTQPGDMIFVNNWAIVHGREAFEDSPEQRRYLVRLWLKNERFAWSLPSPLRLANDMVFYDDALPDRWNLDIENDVKFQPYERKTP